LKAAGLAIASKDLKKYGLHDVTVLSHVRLLVRPINRALHDHTRTRGPVFSLALKAAGLAIAPKALKKYGLQKLLGFSPVG
jgi:hypothetical protein